LRGIQTQLDDADTDDTVTVADHVASTPSSYIPQDNQDVGLLVRITAVKGWGFEIENKSKKIDIPDVYCTIKFGSSPTVWRTTTVKNSVAPEWNESQTFRKVGHAQILQINAFDEDAALHDGNELGNARISVDKILLAGGNFDVELLSKGKSTGSFITVRCEIVATNNMEGEACKSSSFTSIIEAASDPVRQVSARVDTEEDGVKPDPVADSAPEKASSAVPKVERNIVRVTLVKGSNFKVEKVRMWKDDIPDVYCKIQFGSNPSIWRTSTVLNNANPVWNETESFRMFEEHEKIIVEVYDEDTGIIDPDDFLGNVFVSVRELLSAGGENMLEVKLNGKATGSFIFLRCDLTVDTGCSDAS
jgi:Ca2+-dependent lipid-binding protein